MREIPDPLLVPYDIHDPDVAERLLPREVEVLAVGREREAALRSWLLERHQAIDQPDSLCIATPKSPRCPTKATIAAENQFRRALPR